MQVNLVNISSIIMHNFVLEERELGLVTLGVVAIIE